jgi:methionine-rich copper-binding protein CopC
MKLKNLPVFLFSILSMSFILASCSKKDEPALPLNVVSITPANNATAVDLRPTITINFDKAVDNRTISGIQLLNPAGTPVSSDVTVSDKSVSLVPKADFDMGFKYTVKISGVKATDTGVLASEFTSVFTVKTVLLAVVSITPANGLTGVSRTNKTVVIILNKKIKNSIVNSLTIIPIPGEIWTTNYDGDKTLTLSCSTNLKANTKYELFQGAAIESLSDADKLTLPAYSFTTGN